MTDTVEIASPTGEPGINEIFTTSVNIVVEDEDGERGGDSYVPVMYFAAHFTALEVEKTSDPQTLDEPGPATFTITIRNNGTEALELVQVLDTAYGDLLNEANPRTTDSDCPDLPRVIQSNQEFSCTFVGEVGSNTEDGNHLNEVFVTVVDPAGNLSAASADLRIPIAEPGPIDTSGIVIWELFVAEGVIDSVPEGVVVGGWHSPLDSEPLQAFGKFARKNTAVIVEPERILSRDHTKLGGTYWPSDDALCIGPEDIDRTRHLRSLRLQHADIGG